MQSMTDVVDSRVTGPSDLRRVLRAFARGWYVILIGFMGGCIAGWCGSVLSTPLYDATASVYVTSGVDADALTAYQGSLASQQRVTSYAELVTSDAVIGRALESSPSVDMSLEDAISSVSAVAEPDTVIVSITATTDNSSRSAVLANAVADAMVTYVGELERPTGGGAPLAKLTVVSPAVTPDRPVSPRTVRNVAVGGAAGALLGCLVLLVRLRFDTRVRGESDLADLVSLPTLAAVPADSRLDQGAVLDFGKGASAAAESYRRLRTNLEFADVDRPTRRLMITSACPAEGKTSTTVNLCVALAEAGSRVVLVDSDLRKPDVARRFGLNDSFGLTDALRGGAGIADLIQPSRFPGLDILASGSDVPNPVELLGSQRAGIIFDELSECYDYVVVDTPPLLPVTDASVVGQYVDGAVVVVRVGQSRKPELVSEVDMLRSANVRIFGLVLNGISGQLGSYGGSYYGREDSFE